jgi:hypothetical protein
MCKVPVGLPGLLSVGGLCLLGRWAMNTRKQLQMCVTCAIKASFKSHVPYQQIPFSYGMRMFATYSQEPLELLSVAHSVEWSTNGSCFCPTVDWNGTALTYNSVLYDELMYIKRCFQIMFMFITKYCLLLIGHDSIACMLVHGKIPADMLTENIFHSWLRLQMNFSCWVFTSDLDTTTKWPDISSLLSSGM